MKESAFIVCVSPTSGCILMGKKAKTGKWGFFGGKMKEGEDPKDAARREFIEETGVYPTNMLPHLIMKTSKRIIHAFCFNGLTETGLKIVLSKEHSEYRWTSQEQYEKIVQAEELTESAEIIGQTIAVAMNSIPFPVDEDTVINVNVNGI